MAVPALLQDLTVPTDNPGQKLEFARVGVDYLDPVAPEGEHEVAGGGR